MTFRLFGAMLLSEPTMAHCQLDPWDHISPTFNDSDACQMWTISFKAFIFIMIIKGGLRYKGICKHNNHKVLK